MLANLVRMIESFFPAASHPQISRILFTNLAKQP